jgi:hypothetical protein
VAARGVTRFPQQRTRFRTPNEGGPGRKCTTAFRSTHQGNLSIANTADAASFSCIEHVDGDFKVSGDSSFTDASFANLNTVSGNVSLDLNLHRTSAAAAGDPRIRKVELQALQHIGGGFDLMVAEDIPSGTVSDGRNTIGIDALTAVGGPIQVTWRIPVTAPPVSPASPPTPAI